MSADTIKVECKLPGDCKVRVFQADIESLSFDYKIDKDGLLYRWQDSTKHRSRIAKALKPIKKEWALYRYSGSIKLSSKTEKFKSGRKIVTAHKFIVVVVKGIVGGISECKKFREGEPLP